MNPDWRVKVGDHVRCVGGDSHFEGVVVAVFPKLDGRSWRCVVQDARGLLLIKDAVTVVGNRAAAEAFCRDFAGNPFPSEAVQPTEKGTHVVRPVPRSADPFPTTARVPCGPVPEFDADRPH